MRRNHSRHPREKGEHVSNEHTLARGVLDGDRRSLAKAITIIESSRSDHVEESEHLLQAIMPNTGKAIRVGISGVPGVGKSTFIEAFGTKLVAQGKKLAVLAVDPTSPLSGGSIMGDRTRMPLLSAHERVFIRPSPSGDAAGGVARKTREALLLCEAAGYDVVLVETVGAGQGEYLVASMVDLFVILHLPNSGDELQGIKKGILELADAVVVTKADGDHAIPARLAQQQLQQSLRLTRHSEQEVPVLISSSQLNTGIDEFLQALSILHNKLEQSGELARKRRDQSLAWFESEVNYNLQQAAFHNDKFQAAYQKERNAVTSGVATASIAARRLVAQAFLTSD